MLAGMEELPGLIVFFDAECLLCNRSVQWMLRLDGAGRLSFAPRGGETAKGLEEAGVLREEHLGGQSMVLAERGEDGGWVVRMRSDAVIRALECTARARVRLALLKAMPRFLREWGYRLVAKSRYAVFGKTEQCMLPGPGVGERILR